MDGYFRLGYWATLIGGLLLAVGAAATAVNADGRPFSAQVLTGPFVVATALRLLGAIALVIGLSGIAGRQAGRFGAFGLAAYVLAVANLVLQAGWMFCDLFATSVLSPAVLDGTGDQGRLGVGFMLAWLMNVSFALFGIATLRARVFGRPVGVALIAAGVVTLVPLPFDGPVYEVLIGAAVTVAGWYALRTSSDESTGATPPVPASAPQTA